jgi:hypothetical protein
MNAFERIKYLLDVQAKLGRLQKAWADYQTAKKENQNMLTMGQLLKSKTLWTGIAGFAFNAWQQFQGDPALHLSPSVVTLVNAGIAFGVAVFRKMSSQNAPGPES